MCARRHFRKLVYLGKQRVLHAVVRFKAEYFLAVFLKLVRRFVAVKLAADLYHLLAQVIIPLIFIYSRLGFLVYAAVYLPYFEILIEQFNKDSRTANGIRLI